MANIRLYQNALTPGVHGTIDVPAGLSWTDSMALQNTASATSQLAREQELTREATERQADAIYDVARNVRSLEKSIGLRLDRQAEVLEELHGTLLNPAKTRAAERLRDARNLLARADRLQEDGETVDSAIFDRALVLADEAVEGDPANPMCFSAAGAALIGLGRFGDAQERFEQARDMADGDGRSAAARLAARAAFIGQSPETALQLLVPAEHWAESRTEKGAVAYDSAIYQWHLGEKDAAKSSMTEACMHDSRFGDMARADSALAEATELKEIAVSILDELRAEIRRRRPNTETRYAELSSRVPDYPTDLGSYDQLPEALRPSRDWAATYGALTTSMQIAQDAMHTIPNAENFQGVLAALDRADSALSDATTQIAEVGKDIAAQRDAQRRAGTLRQQEVARLHHTNPKTKDTAVILAVLVGPFAWLYTYQRDSTKFWLNLAIGVLTVGIWMIGAWIWAIVDIAMRPAEWYQAFPNG